MSEPDVLTSAAPQVDADAVGDILFRGWGVRATDTRRLGSERDVNVLIPGAGVLKVSNPAEDPAVVDMEIRAMDHLGAVDPGLPVPRVLRTGDGRASLTLIDDLGRHCAVRFLGLVPGAHLEGSPITVGVAEQVGAIGARTSVALQGFFHPAGGRRIGWDMRALPDLPLPQGSSARLRPLVDRVLPALAATAALPSGLQHADVTLTNVLADGGTVCGLVDLGDMHHTATVCDLAVTVASVLRNTADEQPVDSWGLLAAVLRGYQRVRPLQPAEAELLGELVLARLVLSEVISDTRAALHPDNTAYIGQYDDANRRVLGLLAGIAPDDLRRRVGRAAGTSRSHPPVTGDGLRERRAAVMGGPLSPLFYRAPLDIVGGQDVWVHDRDGRTYLDAYNNVAVIGHAHPAVAQAVSLQLRQLDTHSRYLHDGVVELAERLLATMPAELDTCLFTTSGTEANELAWRLATEWTGGTAAVIAEHAYHGSTKWTADLSSNEWPPDHRPEHVGTFAAPRGLAPEVAVGAARDRVAAATELLRSAGDRPALVLADTLFTSEGILPDDGFLQGLSIGARKAGALFLADEVQAGYGRSGQLWRFAQAGVLPDIVTLGKPMGAGHPIGAVITRREIADRLAARYEYFSTFAATPVAAAAALTVLDVLEAERIPERAAVVGEHLRSGLRALAGSDARLGEVRGVGLIAGVDLRGPVVPRNLLEALVGEGVLAGLTGPTGATLKIRPPLTWRVEHADLFLAALGRVLATG
ncbi:aminotransferase class III-fold pyridoxal phosphate-dependent enzyme [Nakamurella sp. YIM 132087]|uniref:Aminotransferase class III-fold pyridoxal phosphate-dependent enzyme n=1 Tax=Nakamurella alba TaxID=2665158 RepID=A0A7K1FJ85_9ACTN|nr:aminotransferase class III-fold pyridoxal phosphate-dependent enzyme [Nakamurella alba]MTD13323.1 aminotransferase class III-fold pyridoxal phosphate-dependent enzyme [Nakamurella alba]